MEISTSEKIKTECGICAIISNNTNTNTNIHIDNYKNMVMGLESLQHRGQESAGICYISIRDDNDFHIDKNIGLVKNIFDIDKLDTSKIESNILLGHVRYSTSGSKKDILKDVQPLIGISPFGKFAIAHNGNIPHINKNFQESDTHFIVELIENTKTTSWKDCLIELHNTLKGAYCITIITKDTMFCMRDQYGYKPLSIAKSSHGYMVSSETVTYSIIPEYELERELNPGEILMIKNGEITMLYENANKNSQRCLFEYIYFMKDGSLFDGIMVDSTREKFGEILAEKDSIIQNRIKDKSIAKSDIVVIGCPNTGILGGKGYAKHLDLEYQQYIVKRKHMLRTFILPSDEERKKRCKEKYEIDERIKDKIVILVDDSIVRGNTMKTLISVLFDYKCKEIHIRITAPPIRSPCYYGIDIPTHRELIANQKSIDEINEYVGATSLLYLDVNEMKKAVGEDKKVCTACFTGDYNEDLF